MRPILALFFSLIVLAACAEPPPTGTPLITVYKSPTCQCCTRWVTHLQQAGFSTKVVTEPDLRPVRQRLGVPDRLAACHTAEVGGYLIEGHVPAQDIQRLLAEKPKGKGITVPGMPVGSPGMEQGERRDRYAVLLFQADGSTAVYAEHGDVERRDIMSP